MDNFIRFNNPALQDAAAEAAPRLGQFTAQLDAISADIKQVEKWLQDSGVCVPVSIRVSASGPFAEGCMIDDTSFHEETEHLEWSEYQGRWRLLYVMSRGYGDMDMSPIASGWEDIDRRPLIETPVATRLKCDEHLPEFVKKAAALLPDRKREPLNLNN